VSIIVLQHNLEVIKVEPDLDIGSFNGSPFYEDPVSDETEDEDPLHVRSALVKNEVKVSDVYLCLKQRVHILCATSKCIKLHLLIFPPKIFLALQYVMLACFTV
jgi:hypothetical protein